MELVIFGLAQIVLPEIIGLFPIFVLGMHENACILDIHSPWCGEYIADIFASFCLKSPLLLVDQDRYAFGSSNVARLCPLHFLLDFLVPLP